MFSLVMRMNPQLRCRFQAKSSESTLTTALPGHSLGPTNEQGSLTAADAVFSTSAPLSTDPWNRFAENELIQHVEAPAWLLGICAYGIR